MSRIKLSDIQYGLLPRVKPLGKRFYVLKSASTFYGDLANVLKSDSDGDSRLFTSIDAAVNSCVASRMDEIVVLPGHTETISSATALNLDVAGVSIIGLGSGSLRPTLTFDTATTATIPVSAANISFENVVFSANFADIVSVFTLTTAPNFKLKNCEIKATATNMNFLYVVDTDATTSNANGLTITDCRWVEPDTATLSMVKLDGDNSGIVLKDNFLELGVNNNKAALMAIITAKSAFKVHIEGNRVYRLNTDTATGAILVSTDQSDNSGIICNNFVQHADTAAEILVTASSGFGLFDNKASGVAGASGYLLPAADA